MCFVPLAGPALGPFKLIERDEDPADERPGDAERARGLRSLPVPLLFVRRIALYGAEDLPRPRCRPVLDAPVAASSMSTSVDPLARGPSLIDPAYPARPRPRRPPRPLFGPPPRHSG